LLLDTYKNGGQYMNKYKKEEREAEIEKLAGKIHAEEF
jgi:hypothetical protein